MSVSVATEITVSGMWVGEVSLPLARAMQVGHMRITERRVLVVEVRLSDGTVGVGYGLTRDVPLVAVVRSLLAPAIVDRTFADVSALWRAMYHATIAAGRTGVVMRAISVIDVAVWDALARRVGQPLWRLLGATSPEVPCMLVAGYPAGPDSPSVVDRVLAALEAGFSLVKVSRLADPIEQHAVLAAIDGAGVPGKVVVDCAWIFDNAAEAFNDMSHWWEACDIGWIEDPLAPENLTEYRALLDRSPVPLGVGDELGDRHTARGLIDLPIGVLRVDVGTVGGITVARELTSLAHGRAIQHSFHGYWEVSGHLAAAWGGDVETFGAPGANSFDPVEPLLYGGPKLGRGTARMPDSPGLGFELAPHVAAQLRPV